MGVLYEMIPKYKFVFNSPSRYSLKKNGNHYAIETTTCLFFMINSYFDVGTFDEFTVNHNSN